jgi:hypothetical protein
MKNHFKRILAVCISLTMMFSIPMISANAKSYADVSLENLSPDSEDYAYYEEIANGRYYADYTFTDFYNLSDEELWTILSRESFTAGTEAEYITCYTDDLDNFYQIKNAYNSEYLFPGDSEFTAFCTSFGLPSEYISEISIEPSPMNSMSMNVEYDVIVPLYPIFRLRTIYSDGAHNAEDEKIVLILALLLQLDENIIPYLEFLGGGDAFLYGDINRDNKINILDAVLLQKCVAGSIEPSIMQQKIGDLNLDGTLDAQDVTLLMKFLVRSIDTLPST